MYVILAFTLMATFAYVYMKSKFCENVVEFHCWLSCGIWVCFWILLSRLGYLSLVIGYQCLFFVSNEFCVCILSSD